MSVKTGYIFQFRQNAVQLATHVINNERMINAAINTLLAHPN